MKTVIIFESVYGATESVARELVAVARQHGDAEMIRVEDADAGSLEGADLILVGGPTHLHGLSTRASRQIGLGGPTPGGDGDRRPDLPGPGLRDWFRAVGRVEGTAAAAFDTRSEGPEIVTGRASMGIARRLHHFGFTEVAAPRSFLVTRDNQLVEGEAERARHWAESVFESLLADVVG
jgi:hypothetical protein